ncbi:hypothetical protein CN676_24185 [Bacillus wiedmannii]|uniref:hypothetical protein n=1 Tax=Bacillus wiedmannii TaxID=1890302 RepID=UPI000BEBCEBD|nr:hypothetical protein [Bacillus wiedmannii]PEA80105.1 hypothetical protein CON92_00560 [Bacillus wiedmannii]PEG12175.1 hypothetical protein CON96_00415 [Bacillus wiedmannii]PEJ47049.1 hypothetical protein CN676_24185 [Bacillus wiedmannii]PHA56552.1 hypothetical protein COE75_28080 [Bacillus wiedmannii]
MTRGIYRRNKFFMQCIAILTAMTIITVLSNVYKDIETLRDLLTAIFQQGTTVIIALIAVTVACISYQSSQKRQENKGVYLNYLALMFMMIIFMLAGSIFKYLPITSKIYLIVFGLYFLLGMLLIISALVETYRIIRKTFE